MSAGPEDPTTTTGALGISVQAQMGNDFIRLRDDLEQTASSLASPANGVAGQVAVNNFLFKLQQPDLTPKQLVEAVKEFTANFPAGSTPSQDEQMLDTPQARLTLMNQQVEEFAAKYSMAMPGIASPATTDGPSGSAAPSTSKGPGL